MQPAYVFQLIMAKSQLMEPNASTLWVALTGRRRQPKKSWVGRARERIMATSTSHSPARKTPTSLPPAARVWAVRTYQMCHAGACSYYTVCLAYVHATFKYHARDWMICQNRRRKQAQVWGMRDPNAVVSSGYIYIYILVLCPCDATVHRNNNTQSYMMSDSRNPS